MAKVLNEKKLKIPKKITNEYLFKFLLLLVWGKYFIISFFKAFLKRIPIVGEIANEIIVVLYVVIVLLAMNYIIKKIKYKDIIFGLIIVSVLAMNMLIYSNNYFKLVDAFIFVVEIFLLYYVGIAIKEEHIDYLYAISAFGIIVYVIYYSLFGVTMSESTALYQGDMDIAYKLLPHLCLTTYYAIGEKRKVAIGVSLIGFVMLFSCGCRGALLIYIAFVICYFIFYKQHKRVRVYFLAIIGFILVVVFFDSIVSALNDFSLAIGRSNRIYEKIQTNMILEDSGRNTLWALVLSAIVENPFWGYGIAGDRLILNGLYSHNLLLEFWISFGIILGTVFIVILFYYLAKGIRKSDGKIKIIILVLFFGCILKLMLSQTYLTEQYTFLLIGICSSQLRGFNKNSLIIGRD